MDMEENAIIVVGRSIAISSKSRGIVKSLGKD